MKTYEKVGLAIGAAALGFAAYQTWMQKEAVDQTRVVNPPQSPITGAKNAIFGAVNTGKSFLQGIIHTGSSGANEVKNKVYSGAAGIYHAGGSDIKYFEDTGQNGLKYLYDKGGDVGNAVRQGTGWFFTKGKDAMGNTYEAARSYIPSSLTSIGGLSGIFGAPKNQKELGKPKPPSENKTEDWMNSFIHPFNTTKAPNDNDPSTYMGIRIT